MGETTTFDYIFMWLGLSVLVPAILLFWGLVIGFIIAIARDLGDK